MAWGALLRFLPAANPAAARFDRPIIDGFPAGTSIAAAQPEAAAALSRRDSSPMANQSMLRVTIMTATRQASRPIERQAERHGNLRVESMDLPGEKRIVGDFRRDCGGVGTSVRRDPGQLARVAMQSTRRLPGIAAKPRWIAESVRPWNLVVATLGDDAAVAGAPTNPM